MSFFNERLWIYNLNKEINFGYKKPTTELANGNVVQKKVFLIILQISQKTPVLESHLHKDAGLTTTDSKCFPLKFAKFLRTRILRNIC